MLYKDFDVVSFESFVNQYMGADAEPFVFQSGAIQVYPLSMAASFIRAPTPLFRAEYNFLLLFLEGGGEQQIDNEVIKLAANDALFIREGHLNAIKSIEPTTDGYYIHIDNAFLPQSSIDRALLNHLTFYPKRSVSKSDMEWISQCCELIVRQRADTINAKEIQSSLLKAIMLRLAEASSVALPKYDRPSEITMLFKELLYDNFMVKREVKFYADALSVTENYLNRCVKRTTDKPPKQHINEVVICHSKVLLQDRSRDISQVAFELNFSDPSYFGRLFRQLTNQSPTEYRNFIKQDLSE
jgi:AraC-like DNA-binding protein